MGRNYIESLSLHRESVNPPSAFQNTRTWRSHPLLLPGQSFSRFRSKSGGDYGAHEKEYSKKTIEGIVVHYVKAPYRNDFGFIRRGLAFLLYLRKSVSFAKSIDNVDLCYAISVPLTVGLAAVRIKDKYQIPFIFEVGDLWPDAPIQMGFIKNALLRKYLTSLERRIYAESKSIVALSPAIKAAIESKVSNKMVQLIPNMADLDFYTKESKNPALEGNVWSDRKVCDFIHWRYRVCKWIELLSYSIAPMLQEWLRYHSLCYLRRRSRE